MFDFTYYRGRVALYAILQSLDVNKKDHIAIQAFTCLAVPEAVIAAGCIPVFIDIEKHGINMDPIDLENKITDKTKAIIIQHTFGIPANIIKIHKIASDRDIPIIEDCCHTLSSKYNGRNVGTFGIASFYSFEWGKPIAAGIGGGLKINCQQLRKKISNNYQSFTNPSLSKLLKVECQYRAFSFLYRPIWYWYIRALFHTLSRYGAAEGNYDNLDDIVNNNVNDFATKMLWTVKQRLKRRTFSLDKISVKSKIISTFYHKNIKSRNVSHPSISDKCNVVFARYPLIIKNKKVALVLAKKANLELASWYSTPIHPLTIAQSKLIGYQANSCPNAEIRTAEIVSLPTHERVSDKYLNNVKEFFNHGL